MIRPVLLDLFCAAGGGAVGYHRAGFQVIGIDSRPQPHYPFEFHQGDALELAGNSIRTGAVDAIHASPPCQTFTRAKHLRDAQGGTASEPDLVAPTRDLLVASGLPYVIENVPGAPLVDPVTLCGSSFGLKVRRHRLFESNVPLWSLPCRHKEQGRPVGVYHVMGDSIPKGGQTARTLAEGQEAMGVDWMTWDELKLAIPPAYTAHIGAQLMMAVAARVA